MVAALFATADRGWPLRLEKLTLDLRFRMRSIPPKPAPIIVVGIDGSSIAEIGRWPWPRTVFARLVDQLAAAGARAVAFDLLLSEPQPSLGAAQIDAIDAAMTPLRQRLGAADRALL